MTFSELRAAAAKAWCLLATKLPKKHVLAWASPVFHSCAELLDEVETDIRVTAGECLAQLWEVATSSLGEGFIFIYHTLPLSFDFFFFISRSFLLADDHLLTALPRCNFDTGRKWEASV